MSTALLLIDLQWDFLRRPGMLPSLEDISPAIEDVLQWARGQRMPVVHIRTRVAPDGSDSMPHWRERGIRECVAGTHGEQTPPRFAEAPGEAVFHKQYFSGFGNPALHDYLREQGCSELWVAGVYTHSCVRATVMDAYERGYRVTLLQDCVAATEPLHARITCDYLDGRAASVRPSRELYATTASRFMHYSPVEPSRQVVSFEVSTDAEIRQSVADAATAAHHWQALPVADRRALLGRLPQQLREGREVLLHLMCRDLGKPCAQAVDELERAEAHIVAALDLRTCESPGAGVTVDYRPHGVVAVVTPWNNPVAIAAGKIVAALLLGNAVVWKPAGQAANITRELLGMLRQCGLPDNVLQLVQGGATEVAALAENPGVDAVSLTGPENAGRALAAICSARGIPLQAELGGNNALLVRQDADIEACAGTWARMAFSFAGQRCTAIRRFVVERGVAARFETAMKEAVKMLVVEDPASEDCEVGPVVSEARLQTLTLALDEALARGARIAAGGLAADGEQRGLYFSPTVLADLPSPDPLVQEETFGPLAVMQVAGDFEEALELVNGVRQGLVAAIATRCDDSRARFVAHARAGIITDGTGLPIHPEAPFGGCKASQIGPPEHGVWDRYFFSRPVALYGSALS